MKTLVTFEGYKNQFESLPAGLFSLPNLQNLQMGNNKISLLPENINELKSIVNINFEDNLVKNFFKPHNVEYPKDIPINPIKSQEFKCIAKKIRATDDEVNINPRSRSAIMRVFKKL